MSSRDIVDAQNAGGRRAMHNMSGDMPSAVQPPSLGAGEPKARLTLIGSTVPEVLTKGYSLDDDGDLVKTAGGPLVTGSALVHEVDDLSGFAELLEYLDVNMALAYGVLAGGLSEGTVLTQKEWDATGRPEGTVARCRECFDWNAGPGIMFLDYDPPEDGPTLQRDQLIHKLAMAAPEILSCQLLHWTSSSSHIFNTETGEDMTGLKGQRVYLMVKDASDIPRAGNVLFKRLWLAGFGRFDLSTSGALLSRTLVDGSVWQPERLDFAAGAHCQAPLEQRRGRATIWRPKVGAVVEIIDTREALPDLTSEEREEYARLVQEAKGKIKPRAEKVARAWANKRVAEIVLPGADDETRASARETVLKALHERELGADFIIHLQSGEAVTVAEIMANRKAFDGAQTYDPLEPDYDGRRVVGKLYLKGDCPKLISFAHGQKTYHLSTRSLDELCTVLGDKLMAIYGKDVFDQLVTARDRENETLLEALSSPKTWNIQIGCDGLDGRERLNRMVGNLQARYVHFPNGSVGEHVVDSFKGLSYSIRAFKEMFTGHAIEVEGTTPGGRPVLKRVNPADCWLNAAVGTTRIEGYRFDPGTSTCLLDDGEGGYLLNLYAPPRFVDDAAEPAEEWFEQFLEYLIPKMEERNWLRNWIAHKVQNPSQRGAAVVLVTAAFGTGRNILIKMLRAVLGERWCADVGPAALLSAQGQGQFDDVFMNKVLIHCDEIGMEGSGFEARQKAYERLKSVVDPYPQTRTLNRKGLSAITGQVYYSGLLASNHETTALPLPAEDRRFAVLQCTRTPMVEPAASGRVNRPDIKAIVDDVLPQGQHPSGIAIKGLHEYLMSLETDVEAFYQAPMTEARATMIEDGEGEVEDAIRRYVGMLPSNQSCFWFDELVQRAERWLWERPAARKGFKYNARKLLRPGFAGWEYPNAPTRFVTSDGQQHKEKGVVRRQGVEDTPADRGRWLGDKTPSGGVVAGLAARVASR